MNLDVDVERVLLAHKAVRAELLAERSPRGHWVGHLASSPPATATAISALVSAHHRDTEAALRESVAGDGQVIEQLVQGDLSEFLVEGVHWLARHQNPDGGWGDCDTERSNIAATMLVQAAFRLTGVPAKYADLIDRADDYVAAAGGVPGLWEKYGHDRVLVAAVLANCALAGMVSWRQVPTLPFELACVPKRWQRYVQAPAARYATPALVAVGLAKFHHDPPRNPVMRLLRQSLRASGLGILERLQAADDGFLGSTPLTAFIVMSLASIGHQQHAIIQRGIEFLLASVRSDASWPIETNLAVTNTTLALNHLAADQPAVPLGPPPLGTRHVGSVLSARPPALHGMPWEETADAGDAADIVVDESAVDPDQPTGHDPAHAFEPEADDHESPFNEGCLDWLLECQRTEPNPLTDVPPGGWAWSDMPGALPNTNDTVGALVALAHWRRRDGQFGRERVERAARLGIAWLLDLQYDDGGWPTFYRDSDSPLEESGADVTAHTLRALAAWQHEWPLEQGGARIGLAIERGWQYLALQQREDGRFIPRWFGNEFQPDQRNPVYGTAEVLATCAELGRLDTELAHRAARWLVSAQHAGGGWGPPRAPRDYSGTDRDGFRAWRGNEALAKCCSVEETALAVAALLPLADANPACSSAVSKGLIWLTGAVEQDAHRRPAAIGFYLSGMWYHERLYPLVFATGALSQAVRQLAPQGAIASVGSP